MMSDDLKPKAKSISEPSNVVPVSSVGKGKPISDREYLNYRGCQLVYPSIKTVEVLKFRING